jgi:hypothetical protein
MRRSLHGSGDNGGDGGQGEREVEVVGKEMGWEVCVLETGNGDDESALDACGQENCDTIQIGSF